MRTPEGMEQKWKKEDLQDVSSVELSSKADQGENDLTEIALTPIKQKETDNFSSAASKQTA